MTTLAYHEKAQRRAQARRSHLEGRLHAARVNGGPAAARPRGNGIYTVVGRGDVRYTVRARSLDSFECDCPAGRHGVACWHVAAVYLRIVAHLTLKAPA